MDSFNDGLNRFLTSCRENALKKLADNVEYSEWKDKQKNLRSELETLVPPENNKVLLAFIETFTVMNGMEYDTIFLYGLTMPELLRKYFDADTAEHKEFENIFIQ
jgi:hypothetical protein